MAESDAWLRVQSRRLSVLYAPNVTMGPASVVDVLVGDRAELYCNADGNPKRFEYR
jgi:hypothetical protein